MSGSQTKEKNSCKTCGKRRHWWSDNERCSKEMKRNRDVQNSSADVADNKRKTNYDEASQPTLIALFRVES